MLGNGEAISHKKLGISDIFIKLVIVSFINNVNDVVND